MIPVPSRANSRAATVSNAFMPPTWLPGGETASVSFEEIGDFPLTKAL
jgi:hypothetical protein